MSNKDHTNDNKKKIEVSAWDVKNARVIIFDSIQLEYILDRLCEAIKYGKF